MASSVWAAEAAAVAPGCWGRWTWVNTIYYRTGETQSEVRLSNQRRSSVFANDSEYVDLVFDTVADVFSPARVRPKANLCAENNVGAIGSNCCRSSSTARPLLSLRLVLFTIPSVESGPYRWYFLFHPALLLGEIEFVLLYLTLWAIAKDISKTTSKNLSCQTEPTLPSSLLKNILIGLLHLHEIHSVVIHLNCRLLVRVKNLCQSLVGSPELLVRGGRSHSQYLITGGEVHEIIVINLS